ncbi:hypothetical protein TL16_g03729 [Triparma laevis f. inornata]|uniref:UDP-glucose 4-epimerase n=1 Tax=Triparma laevis f. inornata TaxID=1714386 RepID=A0A9W7A4W3_9STRA|nr:hypothetical protein TL16_g03729 [Triparma laevis f. inornata]
MPRVLLTGGCGFIGTHTVVVLLRSGYSITVVDNLINSSLKSIERVREIAKDEGIENVDLEVEVCDMCDLDAFEKVFSKYGPSGFLSCIHFAGLKAVGESMSLPLLYYQNNLINTMNLLTLMEKYSCHRIVFSSSATVYGAAEVMPITESTRVGEGITNAYGRTKYMIEGILGDFQKSKKKNETPWSVTILRYFNPVGAHPSGKIGEDPSGPPNNLMPYVSQVAVGRREFLSVFGNDYDTPDGTGVRDYIHVMDLAEGHLSAIKFMDKKPGVYEVFNLGTGNGYSVLDMVRAMEKASGRKIEYKIVERRPGDIATCYANAVKAKEEVRKYFEERTFYEVRVF